MPRAGLIAGALALVLAVALTLPGRAQEFDQAGYEKAITTLLCDCGCHPQSVKDCACGRAAEMRREIAARIAGGGSDSAPMTGDQVIALYVASHGEQIRVVPTASGFNLVAWLGPLVGLLLATGGLVLIVRRWSLRSQVAGTPPAPAWPAPPPGDAAYRERLRRAVEELE